jgi:hypothetical protein
MRLCRHVFATAVIFCAMPAAVERSYGGQLSGHVPDFKPPVMTVSDETTRAEPDIDMFAFMSGKCSILRIAGRDFGCRAVAYFHSQKGRANFTIALDDPADDSHIISFSGENARREQDNLYELTIDQMQLNSKSRPKADGLPVPLVEPSDGLCKQIGNFATRQVSSIACSATDKKGRKYELKFESDGSPIKLTKLRQAPLTEEKRRARQIEQLECRVKADAEKILPRDLPVYINQCLSENHERPATDEQQ